MFAAATSFFARTNISQSYNISSSTGSRSATPISFSSERPGPSTASSVDSTVPAAPPVLAIGLWKVLSAVHKVNAKRVSVWTFDKKGADIERLGPLARDHVLEVLKAEASALGRLRHPSILEMVEPLEETRTELTFATEPVLASLGLAIPGAGKYASLVELDEVEIQKGVLQICKGLSFLHSSAKLIHSNISPDSIMINSAGDWKISGLGLTIPLLQPSGSATPWEFPTFDGRVPSYVQRPFDYMAPEYALAEMLLTSSDMYSLGILLYAVHSRGVRPYNTHGSLSGLRDHVDTKTLGTGMLLKKRPADMHKLDADLQALIVTLLSHHSTRPTPTTLPTQGFFSSLTISTLNFLDRSNFTSKTREEKIGFMKGLTGVMGKFSEGLKRRKLLGSLLEEMKDSSLLPYILPNIFLICSSLSQLQFTTTVLPSLKPLFLLKEPGSMLTLLDNLELLKLKTDSATFRTDVLPLLYNALESEHAVVQERALKAVPDLCETIDYAEFQGVLFPRVALVFTKTRILSVKVATLETFVIMVNTLDQASLTQKLVPLLSKIRTKEPAVMMATLQVQEAMGSKVDREAVATLVLPQLWAMSMGPLLNLAQFQRFMAVIKKLGDRVEKEHDQFLRDSQRLEDRSANNNVQNATANNIGFAGTVDFENLVGGKKDEVPSQQTNGATTSPGGKSWDDDVWGSIFNDDNTAKSPTTLPISQPQMQVQSLPASPKTSTHSFNQSRSKLGAKPLNASFGSNAFPPPPITKPPAFNPTPSSSSFGSGLPLGASKPNYNIDLTPSPQPFKSTPPAPMLVQQSGMYNYSPSLQQPSYATPPLGFSMTPVAQTPPILPMGGILAPTKPATPTWGNQTKPIGKDDWGDFDPLG